MSAHHSGRAGRKGWLRAIGDLAPGISPCRILGRQRSHHDREQHQKTNPHAFAPGQAHSVVEAARSVTTPRPTCRRSRPRAPWKRLWASTGPWSSGEARRTTAPARAPMRRHPVPAQSLAPFVHDAARTPPLACHPRGIQSLGDGRPRHVRDRCRRFTHMRIIALLRRFETRSPSFVSPAFPCPNQPHQAYGSRRAFDG